MAFQILRLISNLSYSLELQLLSLPFLSPTPRKLQQARTFVPGWKPSTIGKALSGMGDMEGKLCVAAIISHTPSSLIIPLWL
jgi:hypothetical protein